MSHARQVEGAARGVFSLEGLGADRGAQPLAVGVGQPALQRLDGRSQVGEGLVGGAVQPGGPARVGPGVAGQGRAEQRVGHNHLHPRAPGQVE